MKTLGKQRQADLLLLRAILERYLERGLQNENVAPRYLKLENISDIVNPFYELKMLIQRVEWLEGEEHINRLLAFLERNEMSIEELRWAIDMFAVQGQAIFQKIEKRMQTNG